MTTTRIYNLAQFQELLQRARESSVPVQVLRMTTTVPRDRDDGMVEMRPAAEITFILEFPDEHFYYREFCVADEKGIVRLDSPLWRQVSELMKTNQTEVVMLRRAGSF
jgi:hypothetical protein